MSDKGTTILRSIMDAEGRKQSWLARELGIGDAQIYRIVNGKVPVSTERQKTIAYLLGREVSDLFLETTRTARTQYTSSAGASDESH